MRLVPEHATVRLLQMCCSHFTAWHTNELTSDRQPMQDGYPSAGCVTGKPSTHICSLIQKKFLTLNILNTKLSFSKNYFTDHWRNNPVIVAIPRGLYYQPSQQIASCLPNYTEFKIALILCSDHSMSVLWLFLSKVSSIRRIVVGWIFVNIRPWYKQQFWTVLCAGNCHMDFSL